jgi:hypothetical protein
MIRAIIVGDADAATHQVYVARPWRRRRACRQITERVDVSRTR